jgi:hypothetical protein
MNRETQHIPKIVLEKRYPNIQFNLFDFSFMLGWKNPNPTYCGLRFVGWVEQVKSGIIH